MKYVLAIAAMVICSTALTLMTSPSSSQSARSTMGNTSKASWVTNSDSAIHWKEMDRTDRKDYMRNVVQPRMEILFKGFNSDKYPRMKCPTCHGEAARTGEYKMPSPDLPVLPKNEAAFKKLSEKDPAMMKFMTGTVKPVVAKLLGMPVYNSKTKSGFSCGNCHLYK